MTDLLPIADGVLEPEATLEDCERVYGQIERNANMGRGAVLRHIRDHRLYRDLFDTFEEYVEQRVGIVRQYAYRLIDLADTVTALSPIGDIPAITNEGQARAIKPVLRDHGPEVAAEVLTEAADESGKITARSITEAAARVIEPEVITADEWMAREGYNQPDELARRRTTDAEKERFRAEDKAKAIRQRNLDVNVAFTTIDSLTHPDVLSEVQAHWQPLAQDWTAARLHQLADILHTIADQWKVTA